MEELLSTEVLDREILEDARKKAFKILKTADDSVASLAKRWEKKTNKAIEQIRKTYEQQTDKLRQEILARDPLDKRRLRAETADSRLRQAMSNFLKGLKREDVLFILERELEHCLKVCGDELGEGELHLIFSSMSEDEAEGVLRKAFENIQGLKDRLKKDGQIENLRKTEDKNTVFSLPLMILNMPALKITASVENAAANLLREKRAELTSCLLGKGALND